MFTLKQYYENEDVNNHTENAVQLAKLYGDPEDKCEIVMIACAHEARGYLERKEQLVRDDIVRKLFPQLQFDESATKYVKREVMYNGLHNIQ
jgi:hypothetical protein|tara:strand:- start:2666 stop:2941 length:276 start_codon:yes stop_codon:yes gene_type:complete